MKIYCGIRADLYGIKFKFVVDFDDCSVASNIYSKYSYASFWADSSSQYIVRRVVIWDLFYRNMIVAFVVGAVVQGAIVYVVWRFRESNKKNFYRRPMGSEHR